MPSRGGDWPKVIVYRCLECGAVSNREDAWDDWCNEVAPGTVPDHGPLQEVEVIPAQPALEALEEIERCGADEDMGPAEFAEVVLTQTGAVLAGLRGERERDGAS